MEDNKKIENEVDDPVRRDALKKLGAIGVATVMAPTMLTLLQSNQASAQSGQPPVGSEP